MPRTHRSAIEKRRKRRQKRERKAARRVARALAHDDAASGERGLKDLAVKFDGMPMTSYADLVRLRPDLFKPGGRS